MIGPLSRILARWLAGALVAVGLIGHDAAQHIAMDPDVALLIGMGVGAAAEAAYALAKRLGWRT